MEAIAELGRSLRDMGFAQLALALAFFASYALTLTGLPAARAERIALAAAALAGAGFAALTDPWMHGVMLVVLAVGVMGLFIGAVWALNALFGLTRSESPPPSPGPDGPRSLPASPSRAAPAREVVQTAY